MNTTKAGRFRGAPRRMTRVVVALVATTTATACFAGAGDFAGDVERASAAVEKVAGASEEKMNAGDFAGANAALLGGFPEATRTPAESFLLGNLLFEVDRKQSYALHGAAAKAEPQN